MSRYAWHRFRPGLTWAVVAGTLALVLAASAAEQAAEYEYDDLGRLRRVVAPDKEISYTLDAAGNRNNLTSATGRGWPSSLTVPASSLSGDYTISWGASTGSGNRYELYEATNPDFVSETQVYNSTGLSLGFTAKPDNTYYYRIRACDATACGPRRTGVNSILVQRPPVPGLPGILSIPSGDIDGTYTISWGASSGTVTAYELYEANNLGFTGQVLAYSGTATSVELSGRGNGNYYYRVRACNTSFACSSYRSDGSNFVWVTLPPGIPGNPSVPEYNNTGTYTATWGASSTGIVTRYELQELASAGNSIIYSGTNTSFLISGRAQTAYLYQVRACNGPACSAYTPSPVIGNAVVVDWTPPMPPTSLSKTGVNVLFWSGGSTDTGPAVSGVTRWRVYRSGTLAGTTTIQSFDDTGAPSNQTYTYTVRSLDRADNESTTASPPLTFFVDNIPPNAPTGMSAVAVNAQAINVSWNAAVDPLGGTITSYFAYRDGVGPMLISGGATGFTDTPLSPSTTYTYTVKAWDLGGNVSLLSAPAGATTPALPPATPAIPLSLRFLRPAGTKPNTNVYDVLWNASPPPPTVSYYVLEETRNSNPPTTYTINAPATSRGFAQSAGGTYGYKVKACTAANVCSNYSPGIAKTVCVGASCNN